MATIPISALPESTLTNDMALAGVEGGVTKKMSGSVGSAQVITALGYTPAPTNSPAFTGTPTTTTPGAGDSSTRIANTAWVNLQGYVTALSAPVTSVAGKTGAVTLVVGDVSGAAPLANPALTGIPTAPTAAPGTNTTQLATTAFVTAAGFQPGIQFQNGGVNLGTPGSEVTVNFTGGGVVASIVGSVLTVNVPTGSGGTVTSVGLSLPADFIVSGSPVINTGTLTAVWNNVGTNLIFAGPGVGSAAPTFRAMLNSDLPNSGVLAATYGDSSHVATPTINVKGVITSCVNTLISPSAIGAALPANIQVFASAGSFTWTRPSGAKAVWVRCIGGGGGGGSGAKQSATNCTGGGGGGAGGVAESWFDAATVGASVSITVGVGGTGGAAVTVSNTNGNAGGGGGSSSFGSFLRGFAGGGGSGGGASGGKGGGSAGGAGNGGTAGLNPGLAGRGSGQVGGNNTSLSAAQGGDSPGLGGGAGGGSQVSAIGGRGGDSYGGPSGGGGGGGGGNAGAAAPGGQGGAAGLNTISTGGTNGTGAGNAVAGGTGATPSTYEAGAGGGGGGGAVSGNGGAGGDGGDHGGAGGGGGTTSSGTTSGKGGDGGQGLVVVITYF